MSKFLRAVRFAKEFIFVARFYIIHAVLAVLEAFVENKVCHYSNTNKYFLWEKAVPNSK